MAGISDAFEALLASVDVLPASLQAFGQSAEDAAKNARSFSESASSGLSALAHAAGMGREAQHAIHAFQEFGPVVGGIIVALKVMKGAYEMQTESTKSLATDMNHFSKTLEETRLFLDDMKKSPLQEQLNKIGEDIAKARTKLLEGVQGGTMEQLGDWFSKATGGQGFDNADYYKTAIKDLTNRGNEIRKRMSEIGDTGLEPKKIGEVGGSFRLSGARELGAYQIDHTVQMVSLLSDIASSTATSAANSGSSMGNPNSSISGSSNTNFAGMSSGGDFGGVTANRPPAPANSSSGGDFAGPNIPEKPPAPPKGF